MRHVRRFQGAGSLACSSAAALPSEDPSQRSEAVGAAALPDRIPGAAADAAAAADVATAAHAAAEPKDTAAVAADLAANDALPLLKLEKRVADNTIEWSPELAAQAREFWMRRGATTEMQLRRLDK